MLLKCFGTPRHSSTTRHREADAQQDEAILGDLQRLREVVNLGAVRCRMSGAWRASWAEVPSNHHQRFSVRCFQTFSERSPFAPFVASGPLRPLVVRLSGSFTPSVPRPRRQQAGFLARGARLARNPS